MKSRVNKKNTVCVDISMDICAKKNSWQKTRSWNSCCEIMPSITDDKEIVVEDFSIFSRINKPKYQSSEYPNQKRCFYTWWFSIFMSINTIRVPCNGLFRPSGPDSTTKWGEKPQQAFTDHCMGLQFFDTVVRGPADGARQIRNSARSHWDFHNSRLSRDSSRNMNIKEIELKKIIRLTLINPRHKHDETIL